MLVLTRRIGEELIIGDDVRVRVLTISWAGGVPNVRIGIDAPESINVLREELTQHGSAEPIAYLEGQKKEFVEREARPRPKVRYLRRKKNEGEY